MGNVTKTCKQLFWIRESLLEAVILLKFETRLKSKAFESEARLKIKETLLKHLEPTQMLWDRKTQQIYKRNTKRIETNFEQKIDRDRTIQAFGG